MYQSSLPRLVLGRGRDSNRWPLDHKSDALPQDYRREAENEDCKTYASVVHGPVGRCRAVDERRRHISIGRLLMLLMPVAWRWRRRWRLLGRLWWTGCPVRQRRHSVGSGRVLISRDADGARNRSRKGGHRRCRRRSAPHATVRLCSCVTQ